MTSTSSRSSTAEGPHPAVAAPALRALLLVAAAAILAAPPLHAARVDLQLRQPGGRPLGGAVLYALPLDGHRLPAPAAAVMDQRDRRFVPQVLPVQTGATVSFPNGDSISHHVYSFSPAKRFELYLPKGESEAGRGRRGSGRGSPVVFDRAGVAALGCNIHDWMLAYILVVDTHWFAKTDEQGRATLDDVPPGRYRLVVWHPRITDAEAVLQRDVRLAAGGRESWELQLRAPLLPSRDQEPGFKDY
jgi:plastocyanin